MPELPEVETVRGDLVHLLCGRELVEARLVPEARLRRLPTPGLLDRATSNARVVGVRRHGKYLFVDLCATDGPWVVVVHFGMSGRLLWRPGSGPFPPHTKLVVRVVDREVATDAQGAGGRPREWRGPLVPDRWCSPAPGDRRGDDDPATAADVAGTSRVAGKWSAAEGGSRPEGGLRPEILFVDPRTFGQLLVCRPRDLADCHPGVASLGPDALLESAAVGSRPGGVRPVKLALVDQRVVAGLGNIYADEILFDAGVRPDASAHRLGVGRRRRLAEAAERVLTAAIAARGSSLADGQYRDLFGRPGRFQEAHQVYMRAGAACRRCGRTIVRRSLGTRSAFYCPGCQH